MKKIFSALLLLLSVVALAQNVKLTGVIKDTLSAPLEMANIMAVNKATNAMESYAITDDAGRYQLSLKANTVYILKASYIGYTAFEEEFTMPATNLAKNVVLRQGVEMEELEIVRVMPVTIKGDTIVYNSDSFTNGSERKLEDVLRKLPGVEVDSDGNVKVEGKSVTKLMVEGRDFFDGDTKLGVKNIPADALDKVEVLRNYNEVSQLKGLENNQENVAMNIRLKEGKKNFWFGDISASASIGEGERYLVNPKLFYYNPKYSVNVIGNINNIGELPLSMQDYFKMTGGFRNIMGKGGTTFNVGSNDLGMLTLRNNRAKSIDTKFGAANFSYNPSKAWTISGFGIFNSNRNELETHTRNQILDPQTNEPATTQTVDDHTRQRTDFSLFKLSSSYIPNANLHFDYDAFLKSSRQTEETALYSSVFPETAQSQDIYTGKKQNPFSFNQNLNFYYTLDDKNVFAFEAQQLYQEEDPLYSANLANNPFPDNENGLNLGLAPAQRYDINQKRFVKTNKFDAKADYYYMLTPKANINVTLGTTHSYQNFDSYLFQVLDDGTTDELNANTRNNVSYSFTDIFAALHYKFITGKFTFNPGVAAHTYSSYNEQLGTKVKQDFTRVLPDVYAVYQIKKSERLQYTYNMTTEFTDVAKFAQGLVLNNYSSLFRGNRNLENALYQNHNLNYFKYNMFNFTQIYGGITYSYRMDAIKNLSAFSGINQVGTVANSNFADQSFTVNTGYSRSFERYYKASASASIAWNKYNNFRFDNGTGTGEGITIDNAVRQANEQFSQTYTASLGTNYKTWPNLEVGYSVNVNDYANNKFYTHSPFARMDYLLTPNITLTADYTYNHYYNNTHTSDNEYDFLNSYVLYMLPNKKWEFKVGGTNLLNTGSLNDDSFSQFSTRTSRYSVQPRYLLLNIRYNI